MIGRWMFSLLFSRCFIQLKLEKEVNISFGGSLLKKVCSRSSISSSPWLVLKVLSLSLEECVTDSSPFKGGLFCVVSSSWKDPYVGQT